MEIGAVATKVGGGANSIIAVSITATETASIAYDGILLLAGRQIKLGELL